MDPASHDPLNNLHVAVTWSMFSADQGSLSARDEGLGLGLVRLSSPDQPVSYYYRVMLHPSLGARSNNLLGGKAVLAEVGLSLRLDDPVALDVGYRYRSHKHNGSFDSESSREQGFGLGLRIQF